MFSIPQEAIFFVVAIVVLAIIASVVVLICLWPRRWKFAGIRAKRTAGDLKTSILRRFSLEEIERATHAFSDECRVGSGAFGNVYRGVLDDQIVAIKRSHAASKENTKIFRNEVELLARIKHRNLVSLIGYCEESNQKILVYEYVPNGSLLEYLVGNREILNWRERLEIAIGAGRGIAHLHEGVEPSIIHRDVKPSNILIGEGFEAKVSDFGLVKVGPIGDESHVSSLVKGTIGYLDPSYCVSYHLTPLSDVFSFGVLLLQLITSAPAVGRDTGGQSQSAGTHIVHWARRSIEEGRIEEILDSNLLTQQSSDVDAMLKMGQLALRCVDKSPKNRPTMCQVVEELERLAPSPAPTRQETATSSRKEMMTWHESFSMDGFGFQRYVVVDGGRNDDDICSINRYCMERTLADDQIPARFD